MLIKNSIPVSISTWIELKTPVFTGIFCWLRVVEDVGTAIREYEGYVLIPKLTGVDLVY